VDYSVSLEAVRKERLTDSGIITGSIPDSGSEIPPA